ncbi:MAG: sialidase family protein [Prevotella sp.]|nr:sialidase family protein [Prevotella sp.]
MKKILLITLAALTFACGVKAQTTLFDSSKGIWGYRKSYYRIPAILNQGGKLWAFTDDRTNATGDIGKGNIKIIAKTSTDNGSTWDSNATTIANYKSSATSGFDYAHGDAAVVCDRGNSNNMLMMCASGSIGYWDSKASAPIRVGKYISTDGGSNWTGTDVTDKIYGIWSSSTTNIITGLFFSSGRICQSAIIKTGSYYRLYAALCSNVGSLVVYSDDFGETWNALGGVNALPVPNGNEAKIEELPNGNVLISSRMSGGRYFNIFTYSDQNSAAGTWGSVVTASIGSENATNGEILLVPAMAKDSKKPMYIALQSVPTGSTRANVSIYWKPINSTSEIESPSDFQTGWTQYQVSNTTSAYSTMTLDNNGNVAFIYEDTYLAITGTDGYYDIKFQSLSLETITTNEYTYTTALDEASHRTAFLDGSTIQDPWVGKVVTLTAKLVDSSNNTKYFYLHSADMDLKDGAELSLKVEETKPTTLDYSYYWVISQDPGTQTYYLSSYKGDGYIGKGYGRDYSVEDENADGAYKERIPVCTDDCQKEFDITGFVKKETQSEDAAEEMDGYAIKFSNDDVLRYVAVSEKGAINWFDHTTKGDYPDKNLGILWTTDFDIKVVGETKTVDNYGSWEHPTHFGFPVKMTRSDNDKADITKEGYYYYATLKLPFAVDLTSAVDAKGTNYDLKVLKCDEPKNTVGEEVILSDITSTLKDKTLPRETPVILRMGNQKSAASNDTQITLYLQPALAQNIITTTGLKGSLGKKKFQSTDNTADNYYDPTKNANFFILGKKTDGRVKFYYMSNQVLAANKAYYVYNGTTSAKSLVFRFDDDNISTGISLPETIETTSDAVIYDLSGRRVAGTAKKGVYIRNGKKYIVK